MKTPELAALQDFIRAPYAWPGGYPKTLIMTDGELLCGKCARANYRSISHSTRHALRDGWQVAGVEINWEDSTATCAHCNAAIESACGETI